MKQLLVIALLLGAIVGSALWYYQNYFHPIAPAEVRVERVTGTVKRGDGGGGELTLHEGDKLIEGSRITTSDGGFIRLGVEEGEQVDLLANSELVIKQSSAEGVNFELKQGRIEANVKRFRDRTMTVGVAGNPMAVQTREGSFKMAADGWGTFDVAATSGQVQLVKPGEAAKPIPVGERRVIADDGGSLLSGEVPTSVLLKVDWPTETVRREKSVEVTGTVTPGSRVMVEGQLVRPARDGKFKATVPLQEGKNQIRVQATGLGEPARAESPEFTVDTHPPKVDTKTDEIWKK